MRVWWNALHLLCCNSSEKLIDAIKLLIQSGIDVNGKIKDGRNALHLLCHRPDNSSEKIIDAIKLLIQSGIDVNLKHNNGHNALHYLCRNNSSEKLIDGINLLIQSGIDVNGKDNIGWNALHYLCFFNSSEKLIDAIELLIQSGIDITFLDGVKAKNRLRLNFLLRGNSNFNQKKELVDDIIKLIDRAVADRASDSRCNIM